MRTTVDLPEPLLQTAKRLAAERKVTLSVVVEDALRGHFSKKPVVDTTPFRLHTVRGRLVNPHLDLDRTSALLVAADEAEFRERRQPD
jgi:hypothetical protein